MARQEIEFLRNARCDETQRAGTSRSDLTPPPVLPASSTTTNASTNARVSVTTIADLLSYLDGKSETLETWVRQVRFLKMAYNLKDDVTKILIGMRLKGKALEWFHSKPEFIEMTADALLAALRGMFYHIARIR